MTSLLLRQFSDAPRGVVWLCLAILVAGAWSFLFSQGGQDFIAVLCGPYLLSWSVYDFALVIAMWSAMSLAMMLPTAAPMISTYMDIAGAAQKKQIGVVPVAILAFGYLTVWLAFALLATLVQIGMHGQQVAGLAGGAGPGLVLIGAGAYQFSGLKHACLSKCRRPMPYFMANWSDRPAEVYAMGLRQGLNCLGCCWAIMSLALVAGFMNPIWMAGAGLFMLLEKTLPQPKALIYGSGLGLVAAGIALVYLQWETFNAVS